MKLVVKVVPNSAKTKISDKKCPVGVDMIVELHAKPENNEANIELIKFLCKHFGVAKDSIKIISGLKSRTKLIETCN